MVLKAHNLLRTSQMDVHISVRESCIFCFNLLCLILSTYLENTFSAFHYCGTEGHEKSTVPIQYVSVLGFRNTDLKVKKTTLGNIDLQVCVGCQPELYWFRHTVGVVNCYHMQSRQAKKPLSKSYTRYIYIHSQILLSVKLYLNLIPS